MVVGISGYSNYLIFFNLIPSIARHLFFIHLLIFSFQKKVLHSHELTKGIGVMRCERWEIAMRKLSRNTFNY